MPERSDMRSAGGRPSTRARSSDPEMLGSVISRLFASRGYGRPQATSQMEGLWREIAGDEVASETRILGLKNGVLTIGVNSTPLMSELAAFHREHLLERLKARAASGIRDLRFRRAPRSK